MSSAWWLITLLTTTFIYVTLICINILLERVNNVALAGHWFLDKVVVCVGLLALIQTMALFSSTNS